MELGGPCRTVGNITQMIKVKERCQKRKKLYKFRSNTTN